MLAARSIPVWLVLGTLGTAASCTGAIGQDPIDEPPASEPSQKPGGSGGTTPTAPSGPALATNGTVLAPKIGAAEACGAANVTRLAPRRVWRLSPHQYVNSVASIFKVDVPLVTVTGDGKSDAVQQPRGFDTDAATNKVYDALAEAYKDTAKRVAKESITNATGTTACVKSAGAGTSCIEGFVKTYAEPAFRRPLEAAELSRYVAFYKTAAGKYEPPVAARMVLEAILQSPHFLYRTELGADGAASDKPVKLTHHEIAAQLSYLIADLPPAALPELTQAAQAGKLDQPAVVKALAEKLVKTPQARAKMKTFFSYYIPFYKDFLDGDPTELKDPVKFPTFAGLKKAMEQETSVFLDKVLETQPSLKAIFGADSTYTNAALAGHYGLSNATKGTDLVKTTVPNRKGLLGHAGVLSALSQTASTSPVHRGLFFYQTLLCNNPGVPDPDATAMLERLSNPGDPKATERQKYDYFVKNEQPICIACHQFFHPIGLALESFDPIGRHRTRENDRPIDTRVELRPEISGPDLAGTYADGFEVLNAVLGSARGRECFVGKYVSYAFGLDADEQGDACAVKRVAQRFGTSDLDLSSLLVDLTQESSFYFRQTTSK